MDTTYVEIKNTRNSALLPLYNCALTYFTSVLFLLPSNSVFGYMETNEEGVKNIIKTYLHKFDGDLLNNQCKHIHNCYS